MLISFFFGVSIGSRLGFLGFLCLLAILIASFSLETNLAETLAIVAEEVKSENAESSEPRIKDTDAVDVKTDAQKPHPDGEINGSGIAFFSHASSLLSALSIEFV